jgi:hypothetical protein
MNRALNWLRRLVNREVISPLLDPLPDLYAQPDLTGSGLGMDWLVNGLGENKEVPRAGDVVIKVVSCGMGTTVRRDIRYRVKGPGRYPQSVLAEKPDGQTDTLHVFYMRRHTKLPRTWILMD